MWRYLTGFIAGVYIGTYYNCEPKIVMIKKIIKENIPNEKSK